MGGSLALAFAAGLLATVNPCGFAMLPSFLSLYLGREERPNDRQGLVLRAADGFKTGLALSAGFGGLLVLIGLLVAAGLRFFLAAVPWVALAIGIALVVLGAALVVGRHTGWRRASRLRPQAGRGGMLGAALFGAGYAVASLSCTLAVFLVVVSQAAAVGSAAEALAVFGAYAAGSATILIALSLSAALAQDALARGLRRALPAVNRLAGVLLVASGLYLIVYWLPSVLGSESASEGWAARLTRRAVSVLATFFGAHVGAFAVGLGALLVVGAALLLASRRSAATSGRSSACCEHEEEEAPVGPDMAHTGIWK